MQNNKIALGIQAYENARKAHAAKRYPEAVQAYNQALSLTPAHPQLLADFARLTEEVGDLNAARQLYQRLGQLRPDCGFEGMIGQTYYREQRYPEAIPWFRRADTRAPGNPDILVNLAASLAHDGQMPEAVQVYGRAYAARPDAETLRKLLAVQIGAADVEGADATVARGMRAHGGHAPFMSMAAEHLLKSGRLGEGQDLFRLRRAGDGPQPGDDIPCDWWDGQPFEGTLLVAAEQGLGDEILASSLFTDLAERRIDAVIECEPRLLPVFRRAFPSFRFTSREEHALRQLGHEAPGRCRKIRGMDLCRLFRRSPADFPSRPAWLQPDPARRDALRAHYRARWPGKRLVGISWKSMRRFLIGDDVKSLRPTDLAATLRDPDSVFMSLQYGDIAADLDLARQAGLAIHHDPQIDATRDIDGLFAQAGALDLVISTSSTTVHVAASQGAPCWVLLPETRGVPWYWGYRGETTPWYPSIRFFRKTPAGTPADLDNRVAQALQALAVNA